MLAALLALATAVPLHAASEDGEMASRTYLPAFYERLHPRTALDMVQQTPGFRMQSGSSARGLDGTLGNVLVNGSRPPAKTAPVSEVLAGIPARNVTAIVLIPAGATEIDMAGHAMLLDVVTVSRSGVEGTLAATGRSNGAAGHAGSAQATMRIEAPRRVVTLDAQSSRGRSVAEDRLIAPLAGQTAARRSGGTHSEQRSRMAGATAQWKTATGGDAQVRVNASDSDSSVRPSTRVDDGSTYQGSGKMHARSGGVAAEFQRPVAGNRATLSMTALASRSDSSSSSRLHAPHGTRETTSRTRQGEMAARAALRWKPSGAWTWQIGADHADNVLQGELRYRVDDVETAVPEAMNRVDESRNGLLATVSWNPPGEWYWEGGLRWEQSFLARRGDSERGYRTTGLLPRVSGVWQPESGIRWRAEVERRIAQLGFSQFLASVGLADDIVTAGAATLSPEASWRYSLDYEYRFGERGLLSVRASRKQVQNPIDLVVLDSGLQAVANVEPAIIDTLESQLVAPLDGLGLPGGLLSVSRTDSRSSTVDPVTGEARPVSAVPRGTSMSLRQDLPGGAGAWGISLSDGTEAVSYGVRQVSRTESGLAATVFGQWRPVESLMVRLGYSAARAGRTEAEVYGGPRSVDGEADLVFRETSNAPPAWDARLEWGGSGDLRLDLGLAWSGTTRYESHTLASGGETVEYSSLHRHPSFFTSLEWLW